MTKEQFNTFWSSTYPGTIPISHYFKHDYADRWFRIHSLPESKRYAETEEEWEMLLHRQNTIITDLLGNSNFLLVTGDYSWDDHTELHPLDEIKSIAEIPFVLLDPIDLHKLRPEEYEPKQFYTPQFSEQTWQATKFDNLLKDIAKDRVRAFFISRENNCIVAPYDGGIDIVLKDIETRTNYEAKYKDWLSAREDGF